MKILIVCSYRNYAVHTEYVSAFIYEQVYSLRELGCEIEYLLVKGGGLKGYLKTYFNLKKIIKDRKHQIIHAHGGLCGFISNLQRQIPVITTYHGSDINNSKSRIISKFPIRFSRFNIFVSLKLYNQIKENENSMVIPCGIDEDLFTPISNRDDCKKYFQFDLTKRYVLFSKMFSIPVKNYPLAKETIEKLENTELVEFIGYTREEVPKLMNACDAVIMTSFSEGSPQFIKEALACNCPIVSVDVGDVKELIDNVKNCYLCQYDAIELSNRLKQIFQSGERSDGHKQIKALKLGNKEIAQKILTIYHSVIKE